MRVAITDAASFLGTHLLEELGKQDIAIKALVYSQSAHQDIFSDFLIDGLDLEVQSVDYLDPQATTVALRDVDLVFHNYEQQTYSRNIDHSKNHEQVTQNILQACFTNQVSKVIYTSSPFLLHADGDENLSCESDGVTEEELSHPYEKSRWRAENIAHDFLRHKGLPIIFTHPTLMVGAKDNGDSIIGNYLLKILRGELNFVLDTGVNLVNIRDVAKGHLLAAKNAKAGSRYIMGNKNIYLSELAKLVSQLSGCKNIDSILSSRLAGLKNRLDFKKWFKQNNDDYLTAFAKTRFYQCNKAISELKMPQSSIEKALSNEINFFKQQKLW